MQKSEFHHGRHATLGPSPSFAMTLLRLPAFIRIARILDAYWALSFAVAVFGIVLQPVYLLDAFEPEHSPFVVLAFVLSLVVPALSLVGGITLRRKVSARFLVEHGQHPEVVRLLRNRWSPLDWQDLVWVCERQRREQAIEAQQQIAATAR